MMTEALRVLNRIREKLKSNDTSTLEKDVREFLRLWDAAFPS